MHCLLGFCKVALRAANLHTAHQWRFEKVKSVCKIQKNEQYLQAQKVNCYFNCNETGHNKADCPKLKASTNDNKPKKDGKSSRQLHMVQTRRLQCVTAMSGMLIQ